MVKKLQEMAYEAGKRLNNLPSGMGTIKGLIKEVAFPLSDTDISFCNNIINGTDWRERKESLLWRAVGGVYFYAKYKMIYYETGMVVYEMLRIFSQQ